MQCDPQLEYNIKVTCMTTEGVQPLQQHFDELKRDNFQLQCSSKMFQKKTKTPQKTPSTIEDPQPSLSSAPDSLRFTLSWLNSPGAPETNHPTSDVWSEGQ